MSDQLSTVIADLKIETTSVDTPPAETGSWLFAFAKFGTRGFMRCLLCEDPARVFVHFMLPGWILADATRAAELYTENTGLVWEARAFEGGFALVASLGDTPDWVAALAYGDRLSAFVDTDCAASTALDALFGPPIDEAATTPEPQTSQASPFEEIGDSAQEPETRPTPSEPKLSLTASGDGAQVTFSAGRRATAGESQRLATALRKRLRSYADVDVDILDTESLETVVMDVRAAEWANFSTQQALMEAVQDALTPLQDMIAHGVTPEVAFGLAGSDGVQFTPTPSRATVEKNEVVFAAAEGTALKPGAFDDERLDEPQSTANLVDVVLRHPGYSDRRVGQVLSILLSIAYHDALRLMQAAPIVIARGVVSSRALTMQEVIEGAGGKIQLTDPDRYPIA